MLELAGGQWRTARYAIRSVAGSTAVAEGISGTEASLFWPGDVEMDSAGNVYVADEHRIRRLDASGVISTFAGTGDWGYGGDEGPATEARLVLPLGMASDSAGNWYIADTYNHRVRKVDSLGVITTIAGTGEAGYSGDNGPATEARLNGPRGVALDLDGNVYVTDSSNHRVRRIDAETRVISTLAGQGEQFLSSRHTPVEGGSALTARLSRPWGVATDSAGNVYVADYLNHAVRKIETGTGIITTLAGLVGERSYGGDGGPATEARLFVPSDVATHSGGNVYVADSGNHRIRKIDATGTITTIGGSGERGYGGDGGSAIEAQLQSPQGVATDSAGNVYVVDSGNYRVRKVQADSGAITTIAGNGSRTDGWVGGPAEEAKFVSLRSIAVDGSGTLFFADVHRVWKLDASGTISTLAGTGEPGYSGDGGPATEAQLSSPYGVATDSSGNVYVADRGNRRMRRIDAATGTIETLAGTGARTSFSGDNLGDGGPASEATFSAPYGVAVDASGNVYVADYVNHRIRKIDAMGTITTLAGTGESGDGGDGSATVEAQLAYPRAVAVDTAGNVYVADRSGVRRIDAASGDIETILETEGYFPTAVAVDGDGNVYVGGGRRIRMVDAAGEVAVLAGTGTHGFSGDAEPAGGAELSVSDLAVDRFGAVWFTDPNGRRIRVLEPWPGQN